ncbi:MAG TPA: CRISPR-associated protein Cas4 [Chloroflexota bacterium]|nr:CRISPR-associated protein Cas4 [Chloroflexota bacterium]
MASADSDRYDHPGERLPAVLGLRVSDVRQFVYCQRIVYYHHCLDLHPAPTYKMVEGKLEHERTEDLEHRRSLKAYGLADGERVFNARLSAERLGLSGTLDMVIVRPYEVIPVEFKNTEDRIRLNHKYQLVAYALLAEERWQRPVRRCFVYSIPRKAAVEVGITPGARRYTHRLLNAMRSLLNSQGMPEPTRQRQRCQECEFRRFCNDVW